jgi:hypothetical protein
VGVAESIELLGKTLNVQAEPAAQPPAEGE